MKNFPTEKPLNGNRKLISACKKKGLIVYNPKGEYNGFGYTKLPAVVVLMNQFDLETFEILLRRNTFLQPTLFQSDVEISLQYLELLGFVGFSQRWNNLMLELDNLLKCVKTKNF